MRKLYSTEKAIMDFLWENPEGKKAGEIYEDFQRRSGKCKIGTVKTYLYNLGNLGMVKSEYSYMDKIYTPAITKKEYEDIFNQEFAEEVLSKQFGGDLGNFVSALSGDRPSDDFISKIEDILNMLKRRR